MPFAANTQAALFYPPVWLLFLTNAGREHLSFWSLQEFVFLHLWLAAVLCFLWLRLRVSVVAATFGAGIFAYSGYMMLQLQHLGFVAGLAWLPLGFMGIDEAAEQRHWRPLWKLVAASAMCFLAGYVPLFVVFAVCVFSYALFRRAPSWPALGTLAALGFSLLICMVQLLPAADLAATKEPENRYGGGITAPAFYLSYLIPNLYRFGMDVPVGTHLGQEYLYLGAPAVVGLLLLLLHRHGSVPEGMYPLIGTLAVGASFLINPFGVVSAFVNLSELAAQVCRDWYFLAAIPLPVAGLAAFGIDRVLREHASNWPAWTAVTYAAVALAWSCLGLILWLPGGGNLSEGWASAIDAAVQLVLVAAGLFLLRFHSGFQRTLLLAVLFTSTAIDYKIHGTSKRFNATTQTPAWSNGRFEALDPAVLAHMRAGGGRVAVDTTGPFPQLMRHVSLTTPQGFDPFLTSQYKRLVEDLGGEFYTNWEFVLHPANREALRILGVRYIISAEQGSLFDELVSDPAFRLLQPSLLFYKVFEYRDAAPLYGWSGGAAGDIEAVRWEPERRVLRFPAAGEPRTLYVSEQWSPEWTATVDGRPATVEKWRGALQAVIVPAAGSRLELVHRPRKLWIGAAVSGVSLGLLGVLLWMDSSRRRIIGDTVK
jgi:hypothetical protein